MGCDLTWRKRKGKKEECGGGGVLECKGVETRSEIFEQPPKGLINFKDVFLSDAL